MWRRSLPSIHHMNLSKFDWVSKIRSILILQVLIFHCMKSVKKTTRDISWLFFATIFLVAITIYALPGFIFYLTYTYLIKNSVLSILLSCISFVILILSRKPSRIVEKIIDRIGKKRIKGIHLDIVPS